MQVAVYVKVESKGKTINADRISLPLGSLVDLRLLSYNRPIFAYSDTVTIQILNCLNVIYLQTKIGTHIIIKLLPKLASHCAGFINLNAPFRLIYCTIYI